MAYQRSIMIRLRVWSSMATSLQQRKRRRFTRIKHDHRFPLNAARYCLSEAGLNANQLDYVGFYDKPLLKFDRLLETYLDYSPSGFSSFLKSMPLWMREKLWMPDLIRTELAKANGEDDERKAKKLGKQFKWKLLFRRSSRESCRECFLSVAL